MKYYRIFTIGLLIVLVGFNIYVRIPSTPKVHPGLLKYVETFKELCSTYKTDCSKISKFKIDLIDMSGFVKLYRMLGIKGTVIGHCWRDAKRIDINREYFDKSNSAQIEQLVLHELGHCVLNKEHTEETEPSIMNPYSIYYNFYTHNYNELMNRFFSCKDFCPVVQFNQDRY